MISQITSLTRIYVGHIWMTRMCPAAIAHINFNIIFFSRLFLLNARRPESIAKYHSYFVHFDNLINLWGGITEYSGGWLLLKLIMVGWIDGEVRKRGIYLVQSYVWWLIWHFAFLNVIYWIMKQNWRILHSTNYNVSLRKILCLPSKFNNVK